MQPNLVVITGGSGVGKSTLARALQDELLPDQWLHFSVDSLFYCLPRSITLRVDQHNDWSLLDSKAIVQSAHACVKTLLDRGHKVIFDTVLLSERGAKMLLGDFAEMDLLLVALVCSWEEIKSRTLKRGDRTLAEAEHGYKNSSSYLCPHLSFDSTAVSAENIAAQLVKYMRSSENEA